MPSHEMLSRKIKRKGFGEMRNGYRGRKKRILEIQDKKEIEFFPQKPERERIKKGRKRWKKKEFGIFIIYSLDRKANRLFFIR